MGLTGEHPAVDYPSLEGVSLADALALTITDSDSWDGDCAAQCFAWFRANRDTLCDATSYFVQDPYFSEMLDAAERIGQP